MHDARRALIIWHPTLITRAALRSEYFLIDAHLVTCPSRVNFAMSASTADVIMIVGDLIDDVLPGCVENYRGVSNDLFICNPAHCNVSMVLELYSPDKMILKFSMRRSRTEVIQLKCIEQRASG